MALRVERLSLRYLDEQTRIGWEALLARGGRQALFVTPEWLGAWADELGQGWAPLLLGVWDDGVLVGVTPFAIRRRPAAPFATVSWLGIGCSDYLGPLVAERQGEAAVYAALSALLEAEPSWGLLDLPRLPAESPATSWLVEAARAHGMAVRLLPDYACPEIRLQGDWSAYLQVRGQHFRHWLRSKRRKLERQGTVQYLHLNDPVAVERALECAAGLHAARWQGRYNSSLFSGSQPGQRFYRRAVTALARRGWTDLAFLELNGEAIAFALGFQSGGCYAYYTPAHAPAFDKLSPGGLLLAHLVERAYELGLEEFDFMLGDEEYKVSWATGMHHTARLLAGRPGPAGRLALEVSLARARLRAMLRRSQLAHWLRDRLAGLG